MVSSSLNLDSCQSPFLRADKAAVWEILGIFARISVNFDICFQRGSCGPCVKFHKLLSDLPFSNNTEYCMMKAPDNSLKLLIDPDSS